MTVGNDDLARTKDRALLLLEIGERNSVVANCRLLVAHRIDPVSLRAQDQVNALGASRVPFLQTSFQLLEGRFLLAAPRLHFCTDLDDIAITALERKDQLRFLVMQVRHLLGDGEPGTGRFRVSLAKADGDLHVYAGLPFGASVADQVIEA